MSETGPNRAARRAAERRRPLTDAETKANLDQLGNGLKDMFALAGKKPKGNPNYQSIMKSLEVLGIEPLLMQVAIGGSDEPRQCVVIPVEELVYKEWQHMTGVNYAGVPQGEEPEDGQ